MLIIYHKNAESAVKQLKEMLLKKSFEFDEAVFVNMGELKEKITNRPNCTEREAFLVFAESKKRLIELTESGQFFESGKLILIVPDQTEKTMRLAIKLFPRFIMGTDDSYDDLFSVLNKMNGNG